MPDFLILGAQKAGTTSLFEYLVSHPGVLAPTTKEVQYFSHLYGKSTLWYRSHFASRASLRRATTRLGYRALTGEASPYYLNHPLAADRAHRVVPDASLIVLVRDPIERAHSHWRMNRPLRTEPPGF
ncbi:MAG: sulfotransferase domain-containing protein, partial [Desulfobacterales bacterium]|nr:sulfotransferase domain-containing protein [Desulfobacterales bacterium]